MSSKKVLLVYPSALYAKDWLFLREFHLQMITLYSFLKENNICVEVLDLEYEIGTPGNDQEVFEFRYRAKDLLSQYTFDFVAISCFASISYSSTLVVAEVCKELNKNCQIIVGGYHPTFVPEDFVSHGELFDYIVQGEGEGTLLEIILGHHTRKDHPCVIQGTPRDLRKGIWLDWEGYKYIPKRHTHIGISFSRGCPFRCSYCSESMLSYKYREYPVDLALRDIKRAVDIVNPKVLQFYDPLFRIDTPWGEELFSALIQERFEKSLWFMTRIDLLKEKHIELLSKLNVRVFLGIETGSEQMLRIMNKTKNPQGYLAKVEENLHHLFERKVFCEFALLFNHPGETPATLDETFSFLERFFHRERQASVMFHAGNFIHLPGNYVSENLDYFEREFGAVIKHKTWWKEVSTSHVRLATDNIPSREAGQRLEWISRVDRLNDMIYPKIPQNVLLFNFWLESIYQVYESHECVGV